VKSSTITCHVKRNRAPKSLSLSLSVTHALAMRYAFKKIAFFRKKNVTGQFAFSPNGAAHTSLGQRPRYAATRAPVSSRAKRRDLFASYKKRREVASPRRGSGSFFPPSQQHRPALVTSLAHKDPSTSLPSALRYAVTSRSLRVTQGCARDDTSTHWRHGGMSYAASYKTVKIPRLRFRLRCATP
jgi:hypothetical protein